MKRWLWIWCALLMCCNMHAQSAWKKIPEQARVVHKKLRNTLLSSLYNHELQIEQANVVNNRILQLRLRCPMHSLEYRSEVKVEKWRNGRCDEYATVRPQEPQFFMPDETVEVQFDLSSFTENGEYIFTFQLHTELGETYFVRVRLNTEEFERKGITELTSYYPRYETLRDDENYVYTWIDNHTEFPGGNKGLVRFLKEHIRHESLPTELELFDRVEVGMIIEKDGSMTYPEVVSSTNRMLDAEAMRLVGMMPAWKPGTIDGTKVRNCVLVWIWFGDLEHSFFAFEGW
ncbi:MAG: energy transducer TonB [Bacteroides sp.]|nr:energy transducer TonB [Bacteroides sp.]